MNETPLQYISRLKHLAIKLQDNYDFMAWILATYQHTEHLDDDRMITQLNTTPEMFIRLALCKSPNTSSANFAIHVQELAAYTNIDPVVLSNLIRQVDSMNSLSTLPRKNLQSVKNARKLVPGILAAARDRTENEETDSEKTNHPSNDDTKGEDDVA